MLAKLTSKNQLTLPKSVTDSLGPVQYFEVQVQSGQVVLTPVRIQRGDAVRAKLAELELGDDVLAQALSWAVDGPSPSRTVRKPVKTQKATNAGAKAAVKKTVKAANTVKAVKAVTAVKSAKAGKATPARTAPSRAAVSKAGRRSAA